MTRGKGGAGTLRDWLRRIDPARLGCLLAIAVFLAAPLPARAADPGPPYFDIYNDPGPRLAAAEAAHAALGPDASPEERAARVSDLILARIGNVDFKGAYELYRENQALPLHPDARAGGMGEGLVAFVSDPAVRADYVAALEAIAAGPPCRPCHARLFAAHHLARFHFTAEDDLTKSVAAHQRALAIAREDLAPDDPSLVLFQYQLTQYTRMLDLDRARGLAREMEQTALRLLPDERHVGWLYVLIANANIAQDRGRIAEAADLWGKVAVMGVRAWGETDPNLLPIFQNRAMLLSQLGRTEEAVATALMAEANEGYSDAKEHAFHQGLIGNLQIGNRDAAAAEAAYRRAYALLAEVPADDTMQGAIRIGLADVLSLRGAHGEALPLMREGLPIYQAKLPPTHPARRTREMQAAVILARAGLAAEAAALMRPVLEANESGLLDLYARDQDRAVIAAQAQGLLRDSVLVALIGGDAERAWRSAQLATISDLAMSAASLSYPGDAAGLARGLEAVRAARRVEEEARARLAEGDGEGAAGAPGLAAAYAAAGAAREAAEAALARDFPDYAATLRPRPLAIDAARALLGPGDAYVLPLVYADRVVTLVLTAEDFAWGMAPTALHEARGLIARLRASLEEGLEEEAAPRFDAAAAHALYRLIFTPEVLRLTRGKARLIFPASGALAHIPPAVLVTEPPQEGRTPAYLIRDHAVALSAGLGLGERPRAGATRPFAGIGAPALAPPPASRAALRGMTIDVESIRALPSLPAAREELEALGAAFAGEGTLLLTGAEATEAAVRRAPLQDYRVLAFATHGLVGGQIAGLDQPALVMTPGGPEGPGDDGLLTASEIATLRLAADWIILSACNSAAGDGPGNATYSGLARAFQLAGARALLLSHWPVRDDAAARLSVATVTAAAAGVERSEALRRAQLALIAAEDVPGAASPSIWAPFVLIE